MGSVYYRDLEHTNSNEEREQFIKRAEDYLKDNLYINYETGEFYDNYPTDFKDSQKSRTRKAKGKMENPNSYVSRLFENLGDQAYWYTLNLGDVYTSWAKYETLFDPAQIKKVKKHLNRFIKGPYQAVAEMSAYVGSHIHIISGEQDYKLLKAETKVYDMFGLVKYTSKSSFAPKDKYDNPEEYRVMLGSWLYWKHMMGARSLPRRSWARLKA